MAGKKRKPGWDESAGIEENVRKVLPRIAEKWFRAGEAAMKPEVSWDDMHDFRLLTKRFRYTLEIFQPLYGPSLEARIGQLRQLQTHLGQISDSVTAQSLLPDVEGADAVAGALQARIDKKTGELRGFWGRHFDGAGPRAAWKNYFKRYAGKGRGPA
jgi:CHAD domain-containing protein